MSIESEKLNDSHQADSNTDADSSFELHSSDLTEIGEGRDGKSKRDRAGDVVNEKVRPPVYIDKINKAAKTILDHNEAHKLWTATDYPENDAILKKINGPNHYIAAASKHDFLKKFNKYFVQGKECSTDQGDQLRSFVSGIRNKRPGTLRGERVKLDAVRKEWRTFLGNVFLGQICNPFIPRHTGVSLQDFNGRIDRVASKIRELLFGKPEVETFLYPAANKVDFRSINLPSKAEIIQDIVNKLSDKESSEMTYLRDQLSEYRRYMAGEYPATPEEDEMHHASRGIIDNYMNGKKLKGAGMPDGGKGKKRMFSSYYFLNTPSPLRPVGSLGSSSDSEAYSSGSSQQSAVSPGDIGSSQSSVSPHDGFRPNSFGRRVHISGTDHESSAGEVDILLKGGKSKDYLELTASPTTVPTLKSTFKSLAGIAIVDDDVLEIGGDEQDDCDEDECDVLPPVTTRSSTQYNKPKQGVKSVRRSGASENKVTAKISKVQVRRAAQLEAEDAVDEAEEEGTQVMVDVFDD